MSASLALSIYLLGPTRVWAARNSAPIAKNDSFITNEDRVLIVSAPGVLGNDTDADKDPLTATLVSQPSNGTLTFNANGSFTYLPRTNFNGADSFAYKANDGRADSAIATVTLTINPVIDPPVANADFYTVKEDNVLSRAAPGVLGNDSDVDGDTVTVGTSASAIGPLDVLRPAHGTVRMNADGSFVYTPVDNFNGTDTFAYPVTDGHGGFNFGRVNITVNPVNDQPVAQNLSVTTAANTAVVITMLGTDVDTPAASLQFEAPTSGPTHGSASWPFFASDAVRYAPLPSFVGTDSFTYTVSDGFLTSTATITVHVKPVLTIADISVQEGFTSLLGTPAIFTVTLSPAAPFPVRVRWSTRDGSAQSLTAPVDYQFFVNESFTLATGRTTTNLVNEIVGDLRFEPNETFFVDLQSDDAIVARSGRCTILNDDCACDLFCPQGCVGTGQGIPDAGIARVGERTTYGVLWTVPDPVNWRALQTIEVRLTDEAGEIFRVLWDEAANTFSLFDSANQTFMHPDAPGSRTHFETSAAVMYLQNSQVIGSGPGGPSVLLNLNLSFKPQAAGRTFQVVTIATNDFGNQEEQMVGTITVLPK